MKIVFFGTPPFSVPFLNTLINERSFEIVGVVTQPDKPSGRGKKTISPEIKIEAEKNKIPVLQFQSLKTKSARETLQALNAELFVVVAYGKLIPYSVLQIPPKGAINVHPSLLPKYRGPSPMQFAILNGDKSTGVSIMMLDSGMDTGPIIAQKIINLADDETILTLEKKIHELAPKFLIEVLKKYESGNLKPKTQNQSEFEVTPLLTREDGRVDWDKSAIEIERMVRAFLPWPTAWTIVETKNGLIRIKILEAKVAILNFQKPIRTLFEQNGHLYVSTGSGILELITLQPEGKSQMQAQAFLAGRQDWIGKKFV